MSQSVHKIVLVVTAPLAASVFVAQAAETTFNGFASFVGGATTSSVNLPSGEDSIFDIDLGYSRGGLNDKSAYTEKLSYSPDSSYGLQIKSNLNQGLSLAAQLSGRGAQDFAAEFEWAYLAYDLAPSFRLQAGRQRTPLYYYSDFIDVGYAYHWMRPPVDVYNNSLPTYEGVSLIYTGAIGNWAAKASFYTGSSENLDSRFATLGSEALYGTVLAINNDYLQLRASYLTGEFYTEGITNKDNPRGAFFASLSANLTLGNVFALAEATLADALDSDEFLDVPAVGIQFNALGSSMVSVGYELGSLTPHLTYSQSFTDLSDRIVPAFAEQSIKMQTLTAGIRWDFHPSAAFKFEFSSRSDQSTEFLIQAAGKTTEADLVTFGFDIIF